MAAAAPPTTPAADWEWEIVDHPPAAPASPAATAQAEPNDPGAAAPASGPDDDSDYAEPAPAPVSDPDRIRRRRRCSHGPPQRLLAACACIIAASLVHIALVARMVPASP